jgi:putative transposase
MEQIHSDRDMKSYGSPRMQQELAARGHEVSENTVAKLMREHGLRAASNRKFRVTTDSRHSLPVAENVLDRKFEQNTPDSVWLADITYVWTREGWLYLACVLDAYSRRIVGWSMSERITKELVLAALQMALGRRRPDCARGCCIIRIVAASMPARRFKSCCATSTTRAACHGRETAGTTR